MNSISIVVPTLGKSPWLLPCLRALRAESGEAEILLVAQGVSTELEEARALADRVLDFERPLGFAAANNRAFAAARGDLLATVNDDAVVEPGWLAALVAALDADPQAAAAQGLNLTMDDPPRIDGRGIAWNRWWQAVQIDHGRALNSSTRPTSAEVFGVSATAAIYRRSALDAVGGPARAFDERLVTYYEDVDLAWRLRRAGLRALCVDAARARHAGSVTGEQIGMGSRPLIYGNRHLVLRRHLGSGFWPRLPWIFARDVLDLAASAARGDGRAARGIVAGWRRALTSGAYADERISR